MADVRINGERYELEPCPFCKGEPEFKEGCIGTTSPYYWVECKKCGCGFDSVDCPIEAIEHWNNRP